MIHNRWRAAISVVMYLLWILRYLVHPERAVVVVPQRRREVAAGHRGQQAGEPFGVDEAHLVGAY